MGEKRRLSVVFLLPWWFLNNKTNSEMQNCAILYASRSPNPRLTDDFASQRQPPRVKAQRKNKAWDGRFVSLGFIVGLFYAQSWISRIMLQMTCSGLVGHESPEGLRTRWPVGKAVIYQAAPVFEPTVLFSSVALMWMKPVLRDGVCLWRMEVGFTFGSFHFSVSRSERWWN